MSIIRRIWLLSFTLIGLSLLLGAVSFQKSGQILKNLDNVSQTQLPAIRNMTLADMMHDGLRAVVFNALYAMEDKKSEELAELIKEADEKSQNFSNYLTSLQQLPIHSETKQAITDLIPELEAYIKDSKAIVNLAKEQKFEEAKKIVPGFMDSFTKLEGKMENLGELIITDAAEENSQGKDVQKFIVLLNILSVMVGVILSILLIRSLSREMKVVTVNMSKASEDLKKSSEELSSTSQSFTEGLSQNAASLEETVASLEEVSSMVRLNTEHSELAYKLSDESMSLAQRSSQEMDDLIKAMTDINDVSKKIEEIISVIDDIAFQTNLLALNAAVEAARAGEQGKGFAVVAEAVRALAQRSASAAKDITGLIHDSVQKINNGSTSVNANAKIIREINKAVTTLGDLSKQIAQASKEQSAAIEQINQAMNQLDQASQGQASSSQLMSDNSNKLFDNSTQLEKLVKNLDLSMYGKAS